MLPEQAMAFPQKLGRGGVAAAARRPTIREPQAMDQLAKLGGGAEHASYARCWAVSRDPCRS
jgi:hypothetical protein